MFAAEDNGDNVAPVNRNGAQLVFTSHDLSTMNNIEPCAADTVRVLDVAMKYVSQNKIKKGQIWCFYDKDDFPSEKINKVFFSAEILNKENKDLHYHCAWSNE